MPEKMLPMSTVNGSRMSWKMTHEEFVNIIEDLYPGKYTIYGQYNGRERKIHVKYNECGHEGYPKAESIYHGFGCPICHHGPSKKTHEEFVEMIESLYPGKYTILGKYVKSSERITVRYNECGHVANPKAAYIRQGSGCPFCNRGTVITEDEFKEKFSSSAGDEYEVLDEYVNSKQTMSIRHITCGTVFERNIGVVFQNGCRCPKCNPSSAVSLTVGVNDIHTVNPEMESLLKNPQDAYEHTQYSKDKVWFVCPYCGNEIYAICSNVALNGLKCPKCNTNYSYGERFITSWLSEMNIEFEYQFSPDWIKPYAYDFEFSYNNTEYIIEVDGGWHFEENIKSALTLEEVKERDLYKQNKAEKNGYKVIRLDYNYKSNSKRSEYLINSIIDSELYDIFGIESYDFKSVISVSSGPFVKLVADLWNSYDEKSSQKILKQLNIKGEDRVRRLLYLAYDLNMIKESPDEIKKLNRAYGHKIYGNANAKKVKCVETGEIFDTIKSANKKYHANIGNYFKYDNRKHSGTLSDGTRLTWEKVGW